MTDSSTIEKYVGLFDRKILMPKRMGRSVCKKHQILYAIICLVLIYVVDNFTRSEFTPDLFLHNRPMFSDVLIPAAASMRWIEYPDISMIRKIYAAPPAWIPRASIIYSLCCVIAFARAVSSSIPLHSCRNYIKLFSAYITGKIESCFFAGAKVTNFIIAGPRTVFSWTVKLLTASFTGFDNIIVGFFIGRFNTGGNSLIPWDAFPEGYMLASSGTVFAFPSHYQIEFCIKSFPAYLAGHIYSGSSTFKRAVLCFCQKARFDIKGFTTCFALDIFPILGGHIYPSIKKAAFGLTVESRCHDYLTLLAAKCIQHKTQPHCHNNCSKKGGDIQ